MGPLPWLLGLGAFLAYLFCAGPTFYWLDSSEFVAAAWGLGVAHPPGHPLPALLGRLVCLLPVGTLSFRVTLASAMQAALATTLMAALCGSVLSRIKPARGERAWVRQVAVVVATLTLGLSYALWFQAVRAEVYALNLMLVVCGVYLVVQWDKSSDRRYLLLAALVYGLALGNHHLLVLLTLPAVCLFVLLRRGRPHLHRLIVGILVAGMLGGSILVTYLPLRAARSPEVNWGVPTTVERVAWVVSAKAFHSSLDRAARETVSHRSLGGVFTIARGIVWESPAGPIIVLLSLSGLYFLLRRRRTYRIGLLLLLLVALNLLSPVLVGLDPYNPDAYGYLCVAVAFLCPGLAVLLTLAGRVVGRQAPRFLPAFIAAVCCFPLLQVMTNLPRSDLRQHWDAEETTRQLLASQAPGTLLLSSYFETVFNLWALRVTADLRPDVQLFHRNFLQHPGFLEEVAWRLPQLHRLAARWQRAGTVLPEDLDRLAQHQPISIEYDLNIRMPLIKRLTPAGLTCTYGTNRGTQEIHRHRQRIERWMEVIGSLNERETRRTVVWTHYLYTRFACQRGQRELARWHHQIASSLASSDRMLGKLAHRCGL